MDVVSATTRAAVLAAARPTRRYDFWSSFGWLDWIGLGSLSLVCGVITYAFIRGPRKRGKHDHASSDSSLGDSTSYMVDTSSVPLQFVHRGIQCQMCEMLPIRGVRYKCLNCPNFDLCQNCETRSLDLHNKMHCFAKVKIPVPALATPNVALLASIYPGKDREGAPPILDAREVLTLKSITHFSEAEIVGLFEQFLTLQDENPGGKPGITKQVFLRCLGTLGLVPNLIINRLFAAFDQDGDGVIDFSELVCGLSVLQKGELDERIKVVFRGYDLDHDGFITRDDLYKMFEAYFQLSQESTRQTWRNFHQANLERWDETHTAVPVSQAFVGFLRYYNAPIPENSSGSGSVPNHANANDATSDSNVPTTASGSASTVSSPSSVVRNDANSSPESTHATAAKRSAIHRLDSSMEMLPQREMIVQSVYHQVVEKLVNTIMTQADKNADGKLSFEEFSARAQDQPLLLVWLNVAGTLF